jgi:ribosome biogenesis GTPase
MTKETLGWNTFFEDQWSRYQEREGRIAARVMARQKNTYWINDGAKDLVACLSGKLIHRAEAIADFPVVGDWVVARVPNRIGEGPAVIDHVITRKSVVNRGAAGSRSRKNDTPLEAQAIAANIDTIFIVTGLDRDYNLRRIERYMTLVYDSNAMPVILLTKADLCDDVCVKKAEVETIAFGVPVHAFCALEVEALEPLKGYLPEGRTAALLGSSGVGKSTITNGLLGTQRQCIGGISQSVGKGIHTTTHRELIHLPGGGLILDNPGMREIQLWDDEGGIASVFGDIEVLAKQCRFTDCRHMDEPGCAVRKALAQGDLDEARFQSYCKLAREQQFAAQRKSKSAAAVEKARWKKISMLQKEMRTSKWR